MNVKLRFFLRSFYKLRYTEATLTKQAGVSLQPVSGALTHSDKQVTKAYVITADIANQTIRENCFYKSQKMTQRNFRETLDFLEKRDPEKILECPQRLTTPSFLSLNWK